MKRVHTDYVNNISPKAPHRGFQTQMTIDFQMNGYLVVIGIKKEICLGLGGERGVSVQ